MPSWLNISMLTKLGSLKSEIHSKNWIHKYFEPSYINKVGIHVCIFTKEPPIGIANCFFFGIKRLADCFCFRYQPFELFSSAMHTQTYKQMHIGCNCLYVVYFSIYLRTLDTVFHNGVCHAQKRTRRDPCLFEIEKIFLHAGLLWTRMRIGCNCFICCMIYFI